MVLAILRIGFGPLPLMTPDREDHDGEDRQAQQFAIAPLCGLNFISLRRCPALRRAVRTAQISSGRAEATINPTPLPSPEDQDHVELNKADPTPVRQWLHDYGDSRGGTIDMVNETRNYVQRVLENLQIYRGQIGRDSAFSLASDLAR